MSKTGYSASEVNDHGDQYDLFIYLFIIKSRKAFYNAHFKRIDSTQLWQWVGSIVLRSVPVLVKKSERPVGCKDDTMSQLTRPNAAPVVAPAVMAAPVRRRQNSDRVIGMTAEPMRTPINRYTQPRLTYSHNDIMRFDNCGVLLASSARI